jgi:cyclohexadienyl dehydratase
MGDEPRTLGFAAPRGVGAMRRLILALSLAMVLTGASSAVAEDATHLDTIEASKVLRVGTTGDYRPFSYLNPTSKSFEGIDIDMAQSLGKALGVEVTFVQTSWPHLMDDLLAGKFDIAMGGISVNLERQKVALFSIPFMVDGKSAVARCTDVAKYPDLEAIDKPGVTVITNPGGTNERFDRATLKQATITVYPDNTTIWQQVIDGHADLMITDAIETRLWQKEHPELCAIHPDQPFNFSEKAYLLPRDPVWKAFVDQWLHQAIETKDYAAILGHWVK